MTLLEWVKKTLVGDVRFVEASITQEEWDELVRAGYHVSETDDSDRIGVICVVISRETY